MYSPADLRKLAKRLDGDDRLLLEATVKRIKKLELRAEYSELKIGKILDVLCVKR